MSEAALHAAQRLALSGSPSPGPEARTLVAHALGVEPAQLIRIESVSSEQQALVDQLVERRAAGEPVQHITGTAYFRYESLKVGPGVFIPRPETEELAGWVITQLAQREVGSRRVVELCAGSGAISAAILHEVGGVQLHAVEKSPEAWPYLQHNLAGSGAELLLADMADAFDELNGLVDVVVANPPYVPLTHRNLMPSDVLDYDPPEALFSGEDGLDAMRVVAKVAARLLRPGGLLAAEHDETHADEVLRLVKEAGFTEVTTHLDLTGRPRFVTGTRVAGLAA